MAGEGLNEKKPVLWMSIRTKIKAISIFRGIFDKVKIDLNLFPHEWKYLIGQKFGGQNFRRTKFFGGQNFRHQLEISALLSAENICPPNFCSNLGSRIILVFIMFSKISRKWCNNIPCKSYSVKNGILVEKFIKCGI